MRPEHAFIVAKREYLARLKSKGFWIATALLPAFMGAMILGPALAASRTKAQQRLAIVDETGAGLGRQLAAALTETGADIGDHGERPKHGAARDLRGKTIVLVDDVSTTGATLEACARVLKRAGAREVIALTAARVVTRPR